MKTLPLLFTSTFALVCGLLVTLCARNATSQVTHFSGYTGTLTCNCPLVITSPKLSFVPPLSTGMPWNILIGYIGGDSIARLLSGPTLRTFLAHATYSDTVKQGLKYLYQLVDYDPMRFFLWNAAPATYHSTPGYMRTQLQERVGGWGEYAPLGALFADGKRQAAIICTDIIAHVRVIRTSSFIDTLAARAKHSVIVTATILDTIKGKMVPQCSDFDLMRFDGGKSKIPTIQSTSFHAALPGTCIQFDYRLEWGTSLTDDGGSPSATMVDSVGNQWIQSDSEYVVFLRYSGIGTDSSNYYATLFPTNMGLSHTMGMYPVVGGHVQDTQNDFGFGTALTVSDFKSALRSEIYSITHP